MAGLQNLQHAAIQSSQHTLQFREPGVGTVHASADAVNPKAEELKARTKRSCSTSFASSTNCRLLSLLRK